MDPRTATFALTFADPDCTLPTTTASPTTTVPTTTTVPAELPRTGTSSMPGELLLGAMAAAAGTLLVFAARRRRVGREV